jgi:hypothetical protein
MDRMVSFLLHPLVLVVVVVGAHSTIMKRMMMSKEQSYNLVGGRFGWGEYFIYSGYSFLR